MRFCELFLKILGKAAVLFEQKNNVLNIMLCTVCNFQLIFSRTCVPHRCWSRLLHCLPLRNKAVEHHLSFSGAVVFALINEINRSHLSKGSAVIAAISPSLTFLLALICASSLRVRERRLTREASESERGATVRRLFVILFLGGVVLVVFASQRIQTAEPQALPSLPNQTGAGAARAGFLSLR